MFDSQQKEPEDAMHFLPKCGFFSDNNLTKILYTKKIQVIYQQPQRYFDHMLTHMYNDFDLVPQVPALRKKLTNDDNDSGDSEQDQYSDDKENDSELAGSDFDSSEEVRNCF